MEKKQQPQPTTFLTHQDSDHILTAQRKATARPAAYNLDEIERLVDGIQQLLDRPDVKGLIFSDENTASLLDYRYFLNAAAQDGHFTERLHSLITKIAALRQHKKPWVAVVCGDTGDMQASAMLWAHYRIATKTAQIGFPASKYGLFPGFGASILTAQATNLRESMPLLLGGELLPAAQAKEWKLIDALTESHLEALAHAKKWILAQTMALPSISPQLLHIDAETIEHFRARMNPAIPGSSSCLSLLARCDGSLLEDALHLEVTAWASIWAQPATMSMLRTLHYHVEVAASPSSTATAADFTLRKLGVLGAGIMGAGIAYVAARAGVAVALKDVDLAQAQHGKEYAERISAKLLAQQLLTEEQRQDILRRISPTASVDTLLEADLIIEAVYEDSQLKATVTQESFGLLREGGIFASNTTSMPIAQLANALPQPSHFIGMHFFSPVDKMPLVEIICGRLTSPDTLGKAVNVVRQLGKVPIVVQDGPAFFTSRLFFNYLLEAVTMLLEGIPAVTLERQARHAGFAIGPLAVLDAVSLSLMLQVYDQLPSLHAAQRRAYSYLQKMVAQGRNGRKTAKGFYDYTNPKEKTLWHDESLPAANQPADESSICKRLLHVMALDSYRCLDEGVLHKPADGDIGSVLGIGFPAHTGGVFSYIDSTGLSRFVAECASYTDHGAQWQIPPSLRKLAEQNFCFYNGLESNWPQAT